MDSNHRGCYTHYFSKVAHSAAMRRLRRWCDMSELNRRSLLHRETCYRYTKVTMAGSRGFEPLGLLHPTIFEIAAIIHSANYPLILCEISSGDLARLSAPERIRTSTPKRQFLRLLCIPFHHGRAQPTDLNVGGSTVVAIEGRSLLQCTRLLVGCKRRREWPLFTNAGCSTP